MNLAIMGLQWGDEGKGKAIDYLARDFDVVVRYGGGHNAGHTIYHEGNKTVLHLLPSGIFSPGTISVIGNGCVVNPIELVKEITGIQAHGVILDSNNLELSLSAPLILPEHEHLDIVFENSRYIKIGTTRRGIGPAYEDLIGRRAVFIRDLLDKDTFYRKVKPLNEYYNKLMTVNGGEKVAVESYIDNYANAGAFLKNFAKNTVYSLNRYYRSGRSILFEGAQGVLLDIDFGTYPFVTSSNPTIGGLCTGTGLPPGAVDKIIGISKAYTTRVGEGPFPSELSGSEAEFLREKGREYGATTGRPRRVGWLDLAALKYAIMINGVNEIFFTKMDVLDEFDEIKVIIGYEHAGKRTDEFDPSIEFLGQIKPIMQSLPGWKTSIGEIKKYEDLPLKARQYIEFIENFINAPLRYISSGVLREQTIKR
ncbi:MAG: adenylosuccinate synthase [Acidobacteria bacterium]|jgi:adenylosuccinate synthase|nr:adenylosuccinate synthase [Acidobacteriota bacterium]